MGEKSPVNIIQEYCIKRGIGSPNYEIITKQGGTHNNIFACTATCGQYRGEGIAANKKEAKKLAAERLVEQIPDLNNNKIFDSILTDQKPLNEGFGSVQPKPPNVPSTSYINLLQEWCIKKKLPSPEYKSEPVSGSQHQLLFETECRILSHSYKGTGDTKKASKHEAARQMYSVITGIPCPEKEKFNPEKLNIDLDQLGIDIKRLEIDTYPDEKIYEEYKRLSSNVRYTQAKSQKSIENCHNYIKDCYNERERKAVCQMLQDLMSHSNAEGDKASIKKKFENILQRLNVKVTYRDLSSMIDRRKCQDKTYVASIAVSTNPELIEIFCCETYTSAQYQAIINLSKMIIQILH